MPSTEERHNMPSTEGKHNMANSWEGSETGLHPPDLANQKNSYSSCSSDERRNWFYGCLSSMYSTSTEVESSLDLNVLLLKMRNNLTFGMDTQITIERKEIVSFTHMSKTDWLHVCWLPGILNRKEVTATWCSDTEYYWNFPRDLATSKSKSQHWVVDSAEPKGASKEHLPRSIQGTLAQKCVTSGKWWFIAKHTKTSVIAKAIELRREDSYTPHQTQIVRK